MAFSLQRVIKLNKTPAFILHPARLDARKTSTSMVKATDDQTVELTIAEDFAPTFVLNCLAAGVASVVDKKMVMAHEEDGDIGNDWLKTHSAGSGAVRAASDWKANGVGAARGQSRLPLRRAGDRARHHPPRARAGGPAPAAREGRHRHRAQPQPPTRSTASPATRTSSVETVPEGRHLLSRPQSEGRALAKPKVREALRWLVDYQGMADSFLKGQFKVHQAFWPSGFFASLTDTPYTLDVAKAKELLAEAGYPDGFEVELDAANTSPFDRHGAVDPGDLGRGRHQGRDRPGEQKQVITKYRARNHQIDAALLAPGLHGPALQRRRLRPQPRQFRRRAKSQAARLAQQPGRSPRSPR